MTVILTGFMGTGKTTVGKQLAQRLAPTGLDQVGELQRGVRR